MTWTSMKEQETTRSQNNDLKTLIWNSQEVVNLRVKRLVNVKKFEVIGIT